MAATGNEKNIENRPGLKRETQSRITEHKDTQPLYLKNIAFDTLDHRENVEFRDISLEGQRENEPDSSSPLSIRSGTNIDSFGTQMGGSGLSGEFSYWAHLIPHISKKLYFPMMFYCPWAEISNNYYDPWGCLMQLCPQLMPQFIHFFVIQLRRLASVS